MLVEFSKWEVLPTCFITDWWEKRRLSDLRWISVPSILGDERTVVAFVHLMPVEQQQRITLEHNSVIYPPLEALSYVLSGSSYSENASL